MNNYEKILEDFIAIYIMCCNMELLVPKKGFNALKHLKADALAGFNYYFDKFCKERGLIYD